MGIGVLVGVGAGVLVGVGVGVSVGVGVGVSVGVGAGVSVGVGIGVSVGVGIGVSVGVGAGVSVGVGVGVLVGVGIGVSVGVGAGVSVGVGIGVSVGVGAGVSVGAGVGVSVGAGVGVFVGVGVGVSVGVDAGVSVGAGVGVGNGVSVGTGVGSSQAFRAMTIKRAPNMLASQGIRRSTTMIFILVFRVQVSLKECGYVSNSTIEQCLHRCSLCISLDHLSAMSAQNSTSQRNVRGSVLRRPPLRRLPYNLDSRSVASHYFAPARQDSTTSMAIPQSRSISSSGAPPFTET